MHIIIDCTCPHEKYKLNSQNLNTNIGRKRNTQNYTKEKETHILISWKTQKSQTKVEHN